MKRLLTGLTLGAAWIAAIVSGSFILFTAVILALATVALHEFFTITLTEKDLPFRPVGVALGLMPIAGAASGRFDVLLASFSAALLVLAFFLFRVHGRRGEAFVLASKFCTGITFIGLLSSHLLLLMARADGMAWLLVLTAITIGSDTGAYYAGVNLGRRKLCPAISPGKTVEGLVGGVLAAVAAAAACGLILLPGKNPLAIAAMAAVVTLAGVCGDLLESIMKRGNQVKDSGSILPGHGGVLDRIDSMLASAPALFYAVHFGLV